MWNYGIYQWTPSTVSGRVESKDHLFPCSFDEFTISKDVIKSNKKSLPECKKKSLENFILKNKIIKYTNFH